MNETKYDWKWDLRASPVALWLHVRNTERFNKAIGIPEPVFTDTPREEGGSTRTAETPQTGMTLRWKEHPYQWTAPSWMSVEREYERGPISSLRTNVSLTPNEHGGTLLRYTVVVKTNGIVGRVVQNLEFSRLRGQMDRGFRRIDDKIAESAQTASWHLQLDPFETPTDKLHQRGVTRLDACAAEMKAWQDADPAVIDLLYQLVRYGPDHLVERMRPIVLARRWGVSPDTSLGVLLVAAHLGMLDVTWLVLCPSCRSTAAEANTLSRLSPSTHCDACNIDFETEFVESVELSFRPARAIREVTPGTYCLGGPGHKPSAVIQLWLQAGEERRVSCQLEPGAWRVAGPRARGQAYFSVDPEGPTSDTSLTVSADPTLRLDGRARVGTNEILFRNQSLFDQVLRVERSAWRDDAITATQAMTHATFRQFFSTELLTPGDHVDVGHVTLMFTDLEGSTALYETVGDANAYAMVRRHFKEVERIVTRHHGVVVKTIGDAIMAAWHDPLHAIQAALALQGALEQHPDTAQLRIKVGLNWGRCIGVTVNGIFDYFGTAVNIAARLERIAGPGEVAISKALAHEPTVAAWLQTNPDYIVRTAETPLRGLTGTYSCPVLCGDARSHAPQQPTATSWPATQGGDVVGSEGASSSVEKP